MHAKSEEIHKIVVIHSCQIVAMMLVSTAALSHAAVLPVSPADDNAAAPAVVPTSSRQGRTLGLLAVGAQAVGTGLSAVVPAAATAAGTVAAVKPMVLLGLGKCTTQA